MAQAQVSLMTLTDTITRAIAKHPADRSRIERAGWLIVTGRVDRISVDTWAVRSGTDDSVEYILTGGTYKDRAGGCQCRGSQRWPERSCSHSWSVDLVQVAEERQRRIDAADQFPLLSTAEMGRLSAWKRKYNAESAAAR